MKPFNLIVFILFFLAIHPVAFSKTKQKKSATSKEITEYFAPSTEDTTIRIPLSLGIPYLASHGGMALHAGMDFKITYNMPLFFGFETGFDILGTRAYYTSTYENTVYLNVPVLLSSTYHFTLPKVPYLHPYAGMVIGPYFTLTNGTGVVFEAMLRPGISWTFANQTELHAEARFGIIGHVYAIQPTIGITFLK